MRVYKQTLSMQEESPEYEGVRFRRAAHGEIGYIT